MSAQALLRECKIAEKHFGHARQLLASQDFGDIQSAVDLLDCALKLWPQWEKALELKARALLYLKRFKDVVNMLHDHIPSLKFLTCAPDSPVHVEKTKLLSNDVPKDKSAKSWFLKYLCILILRKKLTAGFSKSCEREQWRYLVLGQACCHLGMMEDAMILLQSVKKAASAAFRKQSNCMREDSFCSDMMSGSESDLISHLLGNIKSLLRRRTAALASLEAGLYAESVRHFSKILDGRRRAPQGFVAECYMNRAAAYQGAGRIADAIADCNKTLVLNPNCVEALSARAYLFETVRCFTECLHDLEQLKMLYETLLLRQNMEEPGWTRLYQRRSAYTDLRGNLELVKEKIMGTRQRIRSHSTIVDYQMVLGLPRGCSRADVARAYLLISLKHRPEKAAHFIDRCDLVDDRDIETMREAARLLASKLFRLIQQAYTEVLSTTVDEEIERVRSESMKDDKQKAWHYGDSISILPSERDRDANSYRTGDESLCVRVREQDLRTGFVGSSFSSSCEGKLAVMAVATCRELANECWIQNKKWVELRAA